MIHEQKLLLKNHETIEIRPISLSDAERRHRFFVELSYEQTGMVHNIDEIDFHAEESIQQVRDFLLNKRGLWLIALNESKEIIGEIDITVKNLFRVRHNGKLTMGIVARYQQMGIGSEFMKLALKWALEHGLLRIGLSVFASNTKARALYTKFGFVVEGVRKGFIHNEGGQFEDDILMAYYLPK